SAPCAGRTRRPLASRTPEPSQENVLTVGWSRECEAHSANTSNGPTTSSSSAPSKTKIPIRSPPLPLMSVSGSDPRQRQHLVERDTGPVGVVVVHDDPVDHPALDQRLHRPDEVRQVDAVHGRA